MFQLRCSNWTTSAPTSLSFLFPIFLKVFLTFIFLIFILLQPFSLLYIFISLLPSTSISFFLFPFIFLYFCPFLFTPSYYKFINISYIICIDFLHKNRFSLSLSLSLSLSIFLMDFLFFLHLCFRLIIFYIL